jgi:cation transport protein ChaC
MCILSVHYRGCPEQPGLVLGLDRGGSCYGRAFRVAPEEALAVRRYLDDRELVTGVYDPRWLPVRLTDGRRVSAYGYVAKRGHGQYAGRLSANQSAALIRRGRGIGGLCRDYLANTIAHLDAMGVPDRALRELLRRVDEGADNP